MRISDWSSDVCSSDLRLLTADRRWPDRRLRQMGDLVGDGPAAGNQRDPGGRLKQGSGMAAHEIGAKRVDPALRGLLAQMRPRMAAPHPGPDPEVGSLRVGRGTRGNDDKEEGKG